MENVERVSQFVGGDGDEFIARLHGFRELRLDSLSCDYFLAQKVQLVVEQQKPVGRIVERLALDNHQRGIVAARGLHAPRLQPNPLRAVIRLENQGARNGRRAPCPDMELSRAVRALDQAR